MMLIHERIRAGDFPNCRKLAREVEVRTRTVKRDVDCMRYLSGSFTVFKGTGDYEVVVDFDAWAADLIRGRRWHESQQVTDLPGSGMRLRMHLNSIEEMEGWVLSWGTHATVIRPKALIEKVLKSSQKVVARYESSLRPDRKSSDSRAEHPELGLP
jgi:predicted DNA-binding transcriptional regulator YafY